MDTCVVNLVIEIYVTAIVTLRRVLRVTYRMGMGRCETGVGILVIAREWFKLMLPSSIYFTALWFVKNCNGYVLKSGFGVGLFPGVNRCEEDWTWL